MIIAFKSFIQGNMIYKYTKLNESFFDNRMLRFTQPSNFNDPFEGQVNNLDLLKKYKGLELHIPEMSNRIFERGLSRDDIGVLSLSKNKYNLLMWSHYADEYKGMLIEFNPSVILSENLIEFSEEKTIFASIDYNNERLSGELWAANVSGIPVALGRKNIQWKDEKEIRVFCHKKNIDKIINIKTEPLDDISDNIIKTRDSLNRLIKYVDGDDLLNRAKELIDSYISQSEDINEDIHYLHEQDIWLKEINKAAINSIIIGPLADRWKALELYMRGVLSEVISGKTKLFFAVLNPSEYKLDYVEYSQTDKIRAIFGPEFSLGSIMDSTLQLDFMTDDYDIEDEECFEEHEDFEVVMRRLVSAEYLFTYNQMIKI